MKSNPTVELNPVQVAKAASAALKLEYDALPAQMREAVDVNDVNRLRELSRRKVELPAEIIAADIAYHLERKRTYEANRDELQPLLDEAGAVLQAKIAQYEAVKAERGRLAGDVSNLHAAVQRAKDGITSTTREVDKLRDQLAKLHISQF